MSGLFGVLALWSYAGYVARPGRARYLATLLLFCLGLMAKPMLVTLPAVLLLLDYWPLRRGVKLLEKVPFFVMSIAVSIVTYIVHRSAGATASLDLVPLAARVANSLVSYATYILDTLWPANLAVSYPYPQSLLIPSVIAALALAAISALAIGSWRRRPYLTFGWLWYLVTLLPVIGLIQVGAQARADRYTYLPSIGLAIALVCGGSELLGRWPKVRTAIAASVCVSCCVLTWLQIGYWRDSQTLYRHAIAVTSGNYLAHFNLANVVESQGSRDEAIAQLRDTVQIRPRFAMAHAELGQLLAKQGQPDDALRELQTAADLAPDSADTHFRMGTVLGALGRNQEAAAQFTEGLRLQPANADGHYNLAIAFAQQRKFDQALPEFEAALHLRPDDADVRFGLAMVLAKLNRIDDSIAQLSQVLRLRPGFSEARQALDQLTRMKR